MIAAMSTRRSSVGVGVVRGNRTEITFCEDDKSHVMRKPDCFLCENKGADQLRSNWEADQRLCFFRYMDSTIPLLSKSGISSL